MSKLEHPLKAEAEAIRAIILKSRKGITEHIKWNAPSFCYNNEDRVTFHLRSKEYIQLIFHRGTKPKDNTGFQFSDPTGLLEWIAADRATIKLTTMKEVTSKKKSLSEIINLWIDRAG